MRFSSIFQLSSNQRAALPAAPARMDDASGSPALSSPPPGDLPEALDERVRLVGEWQLGDA